MFKRNVTKREKINEIRKMAETDLPALLKVCQDHSDDAEAVTKFENARMAMKLLIIETAIGAHTVKGKNGEWHYVFRQQLPNFADINEICDILDTWINKYECPYLTEKVNDMAMPAGTYTEEFKIDKITKKNLSNGIVEYIHRYQTINRMVVMTLAEYGQKLRKKQNLYTTLIIGGIVITIAGATAAGAYIYSKKKNEGIIEDDIPEIEDIPDVEDIPEVDDIPVLEEQDVPVVEVE